MSGSSPPVVVRENGTHASDVGFRYAVDEAQARQWGSRPSPHSTRPPSRGWSARPRVRGGVLLLLATLTVVAGLVLLGSATVLRAADGALRHDGYVTSDPVGVSSPGHAVVIDDGRLIGGAGVGDLSAGNVGTVRVTATGSGHSLFVGVADSRAVHGYLAGVRRATLTGLSGSDGAPSYREVSGGPPVSPPTDLPFWQASSWGSGTHVVGTSAAGRHWSIVIMNADGSAGVAADLRVGATLPVLRRVADGAVGAGLVLLAAGVVALATARSGVPRKAGLGPARAGLGSPSRGSGLPPAGRADRPDADATGRVRCDRPPATVAGP